MSDEESARLHSAGAIVRHASPFATLDVPNRPDIPPALIEKWVKPLYLVNLFMDGDKFVRLVRPVLGEIDEALAAELLSYLDWRPKVVGSHFVAIKRFLSLEQLVGKLLLRSDVCYAGGAYCVALARLNTPASVDFLREYLDYYLSQPDLWFDQNDAMAALGYLDQRNGTRHRDAFLDKWTTFVANKPNWSLEQSDHNFGLTMQTIEAAASPE